MKLSKRDMIINTQILKDSNNNVVTFINMDGFLYNSSFLIVENNQVVIVDPSFNGEKILEYIVQNNLEVLGIILTHGHWDHWISAGQIHKQLHLKSKTLCCIKDEILIHDSPNRVLDYFKSNEFEFDPSIIRYENWKTNDEVHLGPIKIKILATPGHTAGSVCFLYKDFVFSGDHVFEDSIGHSHTLNNRHDLMKNSLELFLQTIKPNQIVFPGHGKPFTFETTIPLLTKIIANF